MGSTSAASVKKLPSFQKCQRLISRYALALDRLQRNIFETFSENDEDMQFLNNGFCDLQKLETQHKPVCAKFSKCHQHCETPRIEKLIESWQALVKTLETDQQPLIKDPESMRACHCLMKYIIGFCFLESKYYEALLCSWELLRLTRFEDTTCWLLCLLWALRLGEWDLLGHFLAQEKHCERKWPLSTGYLLCVDCVRLAFRLGTATTNWDQRQVSDELMLKMRELLANERKTFLFTQAKCILRAALVVTSRVPNANLEKLGDPLHQRELEMTHYMTVLRSYHPAFFDNNQSSSIQTKMDSADEFIRLCAAYADYMETAMNLCWDFWDAGQLSEAEANCLLLWRNNLTFGNPYWTIRPLSLLFHIRSNIVYEPELRKHLADCLRALVTPPGTSTRYYLQTPKRLIRPSTFRRGSAVDDSFELETANGTETEATNSDNLDTMLVNEMASVNILGSKQQKEQYPMDAHVPNCECTFCTARASNWAMALELEWLILLLQGYSAAQFLRFQQSLTILREKKIQPLRQQLFTRIFDTANFAVVNTPGPNGSQNINATPAAPKKRGRPPRKQPEKENHALKQQTQGQWPLVEVARLEQNAEMATPSLHLNRTGKVALLDREMSLTSNRPFDELLMPPQFIHIWTRALNQMFLEKPPTATSNEATLLNEAKQLCECSQLTHLADWLLLRHFERVSQTYNKIGSSITNQFHLALADFQNYGHLLFREWRGRCCQFLAHFSDSTLCHQLPLRSSQQQMHAWQKAHFHVESMQPSMRQFAQTSLCRKLFRQKSAKPTTTVENPTTPGTDKERELGKAESAGAQKPIISEEDDSDEEKENFSANFTFRDSDRLKACVELLPPDITFVNIALGDDCQLSLTRCHALHAPIVLNLCKIEQDDPMLTRMQELLEASDQSVKVVRDIAARPQQPPPPQTPGRIEEPMQEQQERPLSESERKRAVTFWNERRRLDREMESFLAQLQSNWLSAAAPLLLPLNGRLSATATKIANKYSEADLFSRATAITLVQLLDHLEEQPWLNLANLLLHEEHRGRRERKEMATITSSTWTKLREATRTLAGSKINGVKREPPRQYLLLAVPSTLSHLPWECLPIFKHSPLVMRIPSLHFFEHLTFNFQKIPKAVDGRNSFYVLNPDGDLALTQKRIAQFFDRFHWKGLVGEVPSREQVRLALTENDLFLYIGHGSGGRYFGRSTVRDSECKAVSILMGCSSVKIYNEGPGFDGRSILYEYLTARCPCVVGCLWMVTDGEIDKFFMALIEYCFAGLARNEVELQNANTPKGRGGKTASASKRQQRMSVAEETLKLLAEGMVHARSSCKLAHLTGAAVVAYGLPVVAAMVAEMADTQIG